MSKDNMHRLQENPLLRVPHIVVAFSSRMRGKRLAISSFQLLHRGLLQRYHSQSKLASDRCMTGLMSIFISFFVLLIVVLALLHEGTQLAYFIGSSLVEVEAVTFAVADLQEIVIKCLLYYPYLGC